MIKLPKPNQKKIHTVLTFFVLIACVAIGDAYGSENNAAKSPVKSDDKGTVRMCVEHWPPYTVVENGKVVGGSSVDIAREALKLLSLKLEVDYVPWRRCLEMVKSGERDAVADLSASQRHEFNMVVGKNMSSLWTLAVWVQNDSPLTAFKSLEEYRGKTVGLVKDYDYPDVIKNFDGWKKDVALNDKLNLTKLNSGRFDIALSDIVNTQAVVKENNLKVRYLSPPVASDPLFIAFSAKKKNLAQKYDQAMESLIKNGTVESIYEKQVGVKYSQISEKAAK